MRNPTRATHARAPHLPAGVSLLAMLALFALAASACGAGGAATGPQTGGTNAPAHGVLYAVAESGPPTGAAHTDIYTFGLSDGKSYWHAQVNGSGGRAVLGGGTLYLAIFHFAAPPAPTTAALQAFNASTGAALWHLAPRSGEAIPVAATNDTVYVETADLAGGLTNAAYTLAALRATDGKSLWSSSLGQLNGFGTVVPGPGALYMLSLSPNPSGVPSGNQETLSAIDTSNGSILWHLLLPGAHSLPDPVLSGGVLFLTTSDPTLGYATYDLAVRASDGTVLWRKAPLQPDFVESEVVAGQAVYYGYDGPTGNVSFPIAARRTTDGSLLWQATQDTGAGPLAVESGAVYALVAVTQQFKPTLFSYDATSGKTLMSQPLPALPIHLQSDFERLQDANGVLYVVGSGVIPSSTTPTEQLPHASVVLAISAHDGTVLWQQKVSGSVDPAFLIAP